MIIPPSGGGSPVAPGIMDAAPPPAAPQSTVIPGADSLIGDLLDMDLGGPTPYQQHQVGHSHANTAVQTHTLTLSHTHNS